MESLDNKKDRNKQRTLNICRCCLSDSCYKDISTEYYWLGQSEVYEKILKETFDVYISYQDGAGPSKGSRLICEECIVKLRDASTFKKLVLESEHNFLKHLENLRNKSLDIGDGEFEAKDIKHEINIEGLSVDNTDDFPDADNDATFDENLLGEIKEEAAKGDDSDEDDYVLEMLRTKRKGKRKTLSTSKAKSRVKKPKLALGEEIKKVDGSTSRRSKGQISSKETNREANESNQSTLEKMMKNNSVILINNSNLCLFERTSRKYKCIKCNSAFSRMMFLRRHMEGTHKAFDYRHKILYQKNMSLLKTDVTDLKCKKCLESCKDLNDLKTHLIQMHNVNFDPVDSTLIPFRIGNEQFNCIICDCNFQTFKTLSQHMTCHYQKFVCDTCGQPFYCYKSLRNHIRSVHRVVKCGTCSLKFESMRDKNKHRRKVHNVQHKRYCPNCPETFKDGYKMLMHLIETHGKEKPEYPCEYCGRVYIMKGQLLNHVRDVHKGIKTYSCDQCTMSFYRSTDLRRHDRTHDTVKRFSCDVCNTRFKTKDSLNRHLKRKMHDTEKLPHKLPVA